MHVEICDVSCVLVKTVKTQKQIKLKKKKNERKNRRQWERRTSARGVYENSK